MAIPRGFTLLPSAGRATVVLNVRFVGGASVIPLIDEQELREALVTVINHNLAVRLPQGGHAVPKHRVVGAVEYRPPQALRLDVVGRHRVGAAADATDYQHGAHLETPLGIQEGRRVFVGLRALLRKVDAEAIQRRAPLVARGLPRRARTRERGPEVDAADVAGSLVLRAVEEPPLVASFVEWRQARRVQQLRLRRHLPALRGRRPGALLRDK
mmetsp:Transcript_15801/g.55018  ORF Transcript_15801/g.55018 Transcript_15801/m.55018 type:complete len:213 (+) Transcript_15801:1-639(+)